MMMILSPFLTNTLIKRSLLAKPSGPRLSLSPFRNFRLQLKRREPFTETEFSKKWRKMSEEERSKITNEYWHMNKADWNTLTLDQKKILYICCYDVPELKNPNENALIILGIAGVCLTAFVLMQTLRYFASPPSSTYTAEWFEETKKLMQKQKASPVDRTWED